MFDVPGEGRVMLTRREYYPENQIVPELDIPRAGEHLWEWYMDITGRLRRVAEGVCGPIPPSEWLTWKRLTGNIVRPWEFDILAAMDVAFCDEVNKELEGKRALAAEEAEQRAKRGGKG